jgi:hypothetical protein
MAHKATLKIGSNLEKQSSLNLELNKDSYKVKKCNYYFSKPIQKSGKPSGHAVGGQIKLLLVTSSNDGTFFSDWMLTTIESKDGAIVFEVAKNARKTLYFKNAYCIYFEEDFNEDGDEQMLTKIVLSVEEIYYGHGKRYCCDLEDKEKQKK